jgi:hypothetical protein
VVEMAMHQHDGEAIIRRLWGHRGFCPYPPVRVQVGFQRASVRRIG